MDDRFENFKQKAQYKITGIAAQKKEQLEMVIFEVDASHLFHSSGLFFNHAFPEKIVSTVKSQIEINLFIKEVKKQRSVQKDQISHPDFKKKEVEKLVESLLKNDALQNKLSHCQKEILKSLKFIKSKIIAIQSNNCSNDRLSLIYNCILNYLIEHDFIYHKTPKDSDNNKALHQAIGLGSETAIQKRKDSLIETSFSAMHLNLNSRSIKSSLKLMEQLKYELEFYELLLRHFTDKEIVDLEIDMRLQSRSMWDLDETEFYRHVHDKIIDANEFLVNSLYDEVGLIAEEFTKINKSIIELNFFAQEFVIEFFKK